jgi:hypothetical protein
MKTFVFALAPFCLLVLVTTTVAADGWKMPNLNPFAKKSATPTSARVSDSSGWSMPKLWPSSKKTTTVKRGPSTWQKVSSGTKSMMNKTADFLNPFDDAEDNPEPQITGSNSYFSQVANRKQEEKKPSTFLPSWWSGEEEEQKPRTVQDFLRQERPQF